MLTLHDYPPSLNGWKIRVLLGLLEVPYRSREVALFQGESRTVGGQYVRGDDNRHGANRGVHYDFVWASGLNGGDGSPGRTRR